MKKKSNKYGQFVMISQDIWSKEYNAIDRKKIFEETATIIIKELVHSFTSYAIKPIGKTIKSIISGRDSTDPLSLYSSVAIKLNGIEKQDIKSLLIRANFLLQKEKERTSELEDKIIELTQEIALFSKMSFKKFEKWQKVLIKRQMREEEEMKRATNDL